MTSIGEPAPAKFNCMPDPNIFRTKEERTNWEQRQRDKSFDSWRPKGRDPKKVDRLVEAVAQVLIWDEHPPRELSDAFVDLYEDDPFQLSSTWFSKFRLWLDRILP